MCWTKPRITACPTVITPWWYLYSVVMQNALAGVVSHTSSVGCLSIWKQLGQHQQSCKHPHNAPAFWLPGTPVCTLCCQGAADHIITSHAWRCVTSTAWFKHGGSCLIWRMCSSQGAACLDNLCPLDPVNGGNIPSNTGKLSSLWWSKAFSTCRFQLDPIAWEALQGLPSLYLGKSQHSLVRILSSWPWAPWHHLPADLLQCAMAWPLHPPCLMVVSWLVVLVFVQCPLVGNPHATGNHPNLQHLLLPLCLPGSRDSREQVWIHQGGSYDLRGIPNVPQQTQLCATLDV